MQITRKSEEVITAFGLVIVNLLIKGIFLPESSLSIDEAFSVYHAQMKIPSIISLLLEGNNPPIYEIFLHFWVKLFGLAEFSVRFPSLIFSSITVLYLYKTGIRYLNKRIALYSSLFFIFSNYHIWFSHEARSYALLGLLSVISMYYFMGLVHDFISIGEDGQLNKLKLPRNKNFLMLTMINVLMIYTHYFGFFVLSTQFLFILINKRLNRQLWKPVLVSAGITAILFSPILLVVLNRFMETSSSGTWIKTPNGLYSMYNMLRQFTNAPLTAIFVIIVMFAAFLKFAIAYKKLEKNPYYQIISFWFFFIFFSMFVISYWVPVFLDRYLMPAAIAFMVLLGIAVDYLIQSAKFKYVIPAIIGSLFIATIRPNINDEDDFKEAVEKVKNLKKPQSLVIVNPAHYIFSFLYYYDIKLFQDYKEKNTYGYLKKVLNAENIFVINSIREIEFKDWKHMVLLNESSEVSKFNPKAIKTLNKDYELQSEFKFDKNFQILDFEAK